MKHIITTLLIISSLGTSLIARKAVVTEEKEERKERYDFGCNDTGKKYKTLQECRKECTKCSFYQYGCRSTGKRYKTKKECEKECTNCIYIDEPGLW